MVDDRELNAVIAHSMLGALAVIRGSIETVLEKNLDDATRDGLLKLVLRRCVQLTEQVHDIALGLPDEAIQFLEELRQDQRGGG